MQHRVGSAVQQVAKPPDIGQPRPRVGPCRLKKQMVGLIFAQHIVNQVSGKGHLPARLALAGMLPFDQSADDRHFAERAFKHVTCFHPVDEFVGQYVGGKQRVRVCDGFEAPHAQGIVAGDKAHGHQPAAFHPAGNQHSQ